MHSSLANHPALGSAHLLCNVTRLRARKAYVQNRARVNLRQTFRILQRDLAVRPVFAKDRYPPIVAIHLTGLDLALESERNCLGSANRAVVHPNVGGTHQRRPRLGAMPALDQFPRPDRGFITPCEISYRGMKLPRVSAPLGAVLPAARGRFAAGGRPGAHPLRGRYSQRRTRER